jgi:cell division protein FtsZ
VSQAAHAEANIIFGATIDDALGDEVRVTVIAAGFDGGMPKRRDQRQPALRREQSGDQRGQSSHQSNGYTSYAGSAQPSRPATQEPPGRPAQPRQPAPEPEPEPSYAQRSREERAAEPSRPGAAQPSQPRQPRPVEFDDPNDLDVPDFLK